jgi:biotin operon repressor
MDQNTKEPTELQKVLDKLGPGQSVVKDAIAALAERGIKVSKSAMYQVITGRSAKK